MKRIESPAELEILRQSIIDKRDPKRRCVTICSGTGCHANASEKVASAFKAELKKNGLENKVDMRRTGCHGFCEKGPLVVIYPDEILYQRISEKDVTEIVTQTIIHDKVVDHLLYTDPVTGDVYRDGERDGAYVIDIEINHDPGFDGTEDDDWENIETHE